MRNREVIGRTIKVSKPYWKQLVLIFCLNILAAPVFLLKPFALKILIDSGFGGKPLPGFVQFFFPEQFNFSFYTTVWIAIFMVLSVALIENIYNVVIWILNSYTGEKLVRSLRVKLFDHIQRLSLSYHDQKGTADSIYRIQYDTSSMRTLLISNLSPILTSLLSLLSIVVIMFAINWRFGIITIMMLPPLVILIRFSSKRMKRDWAQVKEQESGAMSVVQEVLTSLRVVKSFTREDDESNRFAKRSDTAMRGQMKIAKTSALFYFGVGMTFAVGTSLFFFFGATYVRENIITLGVLTMVLAYLAQIYSPLEKISRNLNEIQSSLTSLSRVYKLFDEKREVAEQPDAARLKSCKGNISFENVSFAYQQFAPVLKNVSFSVKAGDRIGIIGSTGAGKSTLINLLARFYDPSQGSIIVDGVDIRHYRLDDWRKQLGIVLQDSILFSTTIGENISYGLTSAAESEIVQAARRANIHDFICSLKDGYSTFVGEKGMTLSGGERQRIAIARAFIRNAPILILDEPTSSLDIHTEQLIMEAMEKLMEGRTTFLITHRLETLKNCDRVFRVQQGKMAELNDFQSTARFDTFA